MVPRMATAAPERPAHLRPQQDGGVDRDGAWGRLGNGGKVQHLLFFDPVETVHKFLFHQRDDDIAAAKGESTEEKGGGKELTIESEVAFQQGPPPFAPPLYPLSHRL